MKPIRSCMLCRKKDEKQNLVRIISDKNNLAIYDKTQKINKRAIYFCNNTKCINKTMDLINKGKFRVKVSIEMSSLYKVLNEVKIELGE